MVSQQDFDKLITQLKGNSIVEIKVIPCNKMSRVVAFPEPNQQVTICYVAIEAIGKSIQPGDILKAGSNNHPILKSKTNIFSENIDFSFLFI